MNTVTDGRYDAVTRWLRQTPGATVLVWCAEAEHPGIEGWRGVRLDECVTRLPAYRLIDLVGACAGVVIMTGACEQPDADARLAPACALAAGRLTLAASVPEDAPAGRLVDVTRPPRPRRGLVSAADPVPPRPVGDHARLVASAREAGLPGTGVASPAAALAADGCVACGVCVRSCPHDALTLTTRAGRSVLTQAADRCLGDGACIAQCPAGALSASEPLEWAAVLSPEPRVLADLATTPCQRCGMPVPRPSRSGGVVYCPTCAFRRQHPFGFRLQT